ncbi:hypothetical protein [Silvanigrella aquatica]|uniref:Uncharacterized protein n=1 Tax=Silvanigrella aquatica TaxID=1915309 RepID=A0A1L4D4Y7_9BACT|nr:hypothetical protein [Silvanigrella aquatica]APJ05271.1 hypothetical protein AXG55_14715 [Silvanigrella aquatica]
MSKRFCVSLKDSEFELIENEAKKLGQKPIDIINRAVKESVNIQSMNATIEMLIKKMEQDKIQREREIEGLKKEVIQLQKISIESVRQNSEYLAYIKTSIGKLFANLMSKLSEEESSKVMNEIISEAMKDSRNSFDKILGNM